jgi:lipopolysaccharide export system ATP-binding protein
MPGSITGLLGPNGCGKTTLFQCLLGIIKMDTGKLFINLDGKKNVDIGSMPIHQRCSENQIRYIPQSDSLFRHLSIEQNLRAVGEIFLKNRRELDEKIESLLSEFNLIENRKTLAINLSAGQKKKTQICRALIGNCRILIMDEPLSAVDPITISMIKDLIVRLALNKSETIHVMDLFSASLTIKSLIIEIVMGSTADKGSSIIKMRQLPIRALQIWVFFF